MNAHKLVCGLILNRLKLAALGLSALTACGGQATDSQQAHGGEGTDSNTHWLGSCKADDDCSQGLQCLCGVCTAACEDNDACDDVGAGAQCVQTLCEADSKRETGLCSKGCEDDNDCPDDGNCEQSVCVPKNASLPQPPAPLPCAAMEIYDKDLPCTSPAEYYWNGNGCAPQATCRCAGADCSETFATQAACLRAYAECTVNPPDPSQVPEACAFLLELDPTGACGESDEQCQQMEGDGRVHAFSCQVIDRYTAEDGEELPLSDEEQAARAACVDDWLSQMGVSDVVANASPDVPNTVGAKGTWSEVGALFEVEGLRCTANCDANSCDYCYEFGESICNDDPFCRANSGAPVDEAAACVRPTEFASCSPFDSTCDTAMGAARDLDGRCWALASICYEPGFDYADETCRSDYPECSAVPVEPPVEGCEALDAQEGAQAGGADCDAVARYTWNGSACVPIACGCQGDDCERLYDSLDECTNRWVGCIDAVPLCTPERVPYQLAAGFSWGPTEQPDPALAEWTTSAWTAPFELPIEVEPCSDVEGFEGSACGTIKGLTFSEGFAEPLRLDLQLPDEVWSRIDVAEGDAIELRITSSELAVRTANDQLPLLLIGKGGSEDNTSPTVEWTFDALNVQTGAPFCKLPDQDEPGCNWLTVTQTLRFSLPIDAPPNEDGSRDEQVVTLEPFRDAELSVGTDEGSQRYHLMHGRSLFTTSEKPGLETCAVAFTRVDSFSVVRVVDDAP